MREPTVVVGIATKAHGIRGEIAIQRRTDNPDRWVEGGMVFDEGGTSYTITGVRGGGARLVVRLAGVTDRTAAEALRGRAFVVPVSWLPALPEGEYWPYQLEGAEVVTQSGRPLGTLADVVSNPANDLWVVVDPSGDQTFVPAIRDVVVDVDVDAKRIVVREVPGLTAPDDA